MATKLFTKTTQLVQPAWSPQVIIPDGIYVNGRFFEENIPILGAVLTIGIKPTRHLRERSAWLSIPTFQNGKVGLEQRVFKWYPLQDQEQKQTIDFGDAFYGMGLNILNWSLIVDLVTSAAVIYTANYELEVRY
jgi:hypothetical protein